MGLQGSSGDPHRDQAGRIALASICAQQLADIWAGGAHAELEEPALLVLDLEDSLGNLLARTCRQAHAMDGRSGIARIVAHPECPTILTVLLDYGEARTLIRSARPDLRLGGQRSAADAVPVVVVSMSGATTFMLEIVSIAGDDTARRSGNRSQPGGVFSVN